MKRALLKAPVTGIYHIVCRGNNRDFIFDQQAAKRRYIYLLKQAKKRFGFELYAWVIMSNHVHLLLKVNETPLSAIMHHIQMSFSHWYNAKYKHTGHVFEGPYRFLECANLFYFKNIIRYIHQNPTRAALPNGIMYRWSSHRDYVGDGLWDVTDVDAVLSQFNGNPRQVKELYQAYMGQKEELIPKLELESIYLVEGVEPEPDLEMDLDLCAEAGSEMGAGLGA